MGTECGRGGAIAGCQQLHSHRWYCYWRPLGIARHDRRLVIVVVQQLVVQLQLRIKSETVETNGNP